MFIPILILLVVLILLLKWADNIEVEIPQNTTKSAELESSMEKKIMEENIKKALSLIKGKETVSWSLFKRCIGSNDATHTVITVLTKAKFIFPTQENGIYKVNNGETYEIDYEQCGISKADVESLKEIHMSPTEVMSGSTIALPPSGAGGGLRIIGFVFLLFSVISIASSLSAEYTTHVANYLSYAIYWLLMGLCCFVGAGLQKVAAYIQFYGTVFQKGSLDAFHNR